MVVIRQEFASTVLELDDGRILHLEHQSTKEATLHRFLGYDAQLARVFQRPIRTVILYTEDVVDGPLDLDAGSIQYKVDNVDLARFDGERASLAGPCADSVAVGRSEVNRLQRKWAI